MIFVLFQRPMIRFLDALAGASKTYQIIRLAIRNAKSGHKVVIVQPTIKLIQATAEEIRSLAPEIRTTELHSETVKGSTVKAISSHLQDGFPEGEVLLLTHESFDRLPYFHNKSVWDVIFDETPKAEQCFERNLPETHRLLTDHLSVVPSDNKSYALLKAKDRSLIKRMARNEGDDSIWNNLKPLTNLLLSPNWVSYVHLESYQNLCGGDGQKLITFSVRDPDPLRGFNSVLMAGALFSESLLYRLWSRQGMRFAPEAELQANLRYREHGNGDTAQIYFASEERWSKHLRDQDDGRALERFKDAIQTRLQDKPFIWMGNVDQPDNFFESKEAVRLPNSPHGLNDYQGFDHIAVLSALNPSPPHYKFLNSQGITPDEVRTAVSGHPIYQAVMRGSLRDPLNRNPKTIIVPDRQTAQWLAGLFPGSKVESLGIDIGGTRKRAGRPQQHQNPADKQRRYRARKEMLKELERLNLLANLAHSDPRELQVPLNETVNAPCYENTTLYSHFVTKHFRATLFKTLESKLAIHTVSLCAEEFVESLRELNKQTVEFKESRLLLSPSFFDPGLSNETSKGLDNVVFCNGIWLDNDCGDLTPDRFAQMLPGLRMVIFNSYSSTRDQPRWRVYIPTTHIMSREVYEAITAQIIQRVKDEGFPLPKPDPKRPNLKTHGFDPSKLHPASLFRLPCQAKDPGGSFFIDHNAPPRQPLNPFEWIKEGQSDSWKEFVDDPISPPTSINQIRVGAAIEKFRNGSRDHFSFFKLGLALLYCGCSEADLKSYLLSEGTGRWERRKLQKKIKDVIASLRRYGHLR